MWCEKVLDHRAELRFHQNGTDWDWKGWGGALDVEKVAGVWMSCNFGIGMSTVEGDTPEGPWDTFDRDLAIRCSEGVCSWQGAQGSSGWLWNSLLGTRSTQKIQRHVQPHMWDLCCSSFPEGCEAEGWTGTERVSPAFQVVLQCPVEGGDHQGNLVLERALVLAWILVDFRLFQGT